MKNYAVLVCRAEGPHQSWSDCTRHSRVTTRREPTKSGFVGLLCYASGRPFDDDAFVARLAALDMVSRTDREGTIWKDFQTVRNLRSANGEPNIHAHLSVREYLENARFKVAFGGPSDLILELENALMFPAHPLWLGKKACAPTAPIWVPGGVVATGETPRQVLERWPWKRQEEKHPPKRLRLTLDLGVGSTQGEIRHDYPISLNEQNRCFVDRRVDTAWVSTEDLPHEQDESRADATKDHALV